MAYDKTLTGEAYEQITKPCEVINTIGKEKQARSYNPPTSHLDPIVEIPKPVKRVFSLSEYREMCTHSEARNSNHE